MQAEAQKASLEVSPLNNDGNVSIKVCGDWILDTKLPDRKELWNQFPSEATATLDFDFSSLGKWDTGLVVFLLGCIEESVRRGVQINQKQFPDGVRKLIDLSQAVPEKQTGRTEEPTSFLQTLGHNTREVLEGVNTFLAFTGEVTMGFARIFGKNKMFRPIDFITILYQCSAAALPIVGLISLLSGLTMAFVGAVQLQKFGAEIFVADLVGLAMVREMGALMAAIVMTGRTGASFAAQLGNMRVSEEIDALETLGIRPIDFLVVPRLIALILVMPLLCMYANVIGIIGGYLVGVLMLDMSTHQYITQTFKAMSLNDLFSGEIKSVFFGMVVAASGCFYGIHCGQSSAAVGRAVTRSVVTGITFIIVVDAVFAVIFHILGI